jgi:hypothetical protein
VIPDPHYDVNAREGCWVTTREWWYRRSFDTPAFTDALELTFGPADGPADVWLNELSGSARGTRAGPGGCSRP